MPPDVYPTTWEAPAAGATGQAGMADGPAPAEWWRPASSEPRPSGGLSLASADDGVSPVAFWSLMAFTWVLIFSPQAYFPALAPLRPALLVIGVCMLAYMLDRWARHKPIVEWTFQLKMTAGLILWAAVTVPLSIWPGGSLSVLVDQYLKTVAIFWLLSHVVRTNERFRQVAWWLTWMAIGLSLIVFYNYVTGATIGPGVNEERLRGNEGSLTKNPNDLALMINLIVPLTVGLLLGATGAWKRNVLLVALGLEASTVVLSYSRGGAVTLGVIVLLYLWKLRRRPERSWLWGLVLAGVMLLPFAPSSYFDRLSTITNVEADRTGSAQERWGDMIVAARTIAANPFIGAGIGMNTLAMREARGGWLPVHNVYLEHALDLGLLGLTLFVLLLSSCLKATVVAQRSYAQLGLGDMRLLAEGLQISLIAYATAAMFHPVSYHSYFYYMAGLAVAAWKICAPARPATEVHT